MLDAIHHQAVDHRAHDRVQAGGRLVEEHDVGLGGDGAGQRDALLHAAGQFRRVKLADAGGEADLGEEVGGAGGGPRARGSLRCASRPKATFSQTGRLSNSAPFWNSMPIRERAASALVAGQRQDILAVDLDAAGVGLDQAEDAFQQHRLAGAGAADHHHGGARHDVEVDAVEHELVAEALCRLRRRIFGVVSVMQWVMPWGGAV